MAQGKNTRSGAVSDEETERTDFRRIEVNLNSLFEAQNQRLIQTCNNNNLNIEQNAKSIAELNELLLGLSMQVSKLVANEGRGSANAGPEGDSENTQTPQGFRGRNNSFSSRMTKIEFPKFDGTELRSWIYKCNQFFQLDEIADPQRVKLAAIHLEGKALLWHQTLAKRCNNVLPGWDKYVEALTVRFGDIYDDPMADLKALKQVGSVQDYHDTFDALTSRLNLPEEYLLSCYLGGLEDDIQLSVRMFAPKSIQQALCLAKLQEASLSAKKTKNSHKPPLLPTPQYNKQYTPPPKANTSTHQPTTTTTNTNRRTLTPAEFNDKRAKNICFWCDERYTPGHKCKGKKP